MPKIQKILLITLVIFGFFIFGNTKAGPADNVSGWAWSENIGWISFNNTSGGGATNYGVNIETDGVFSGYAWSENIGWISFNTGDLTGCPTAPCQAKLDFGTKEVSGWAKALTDGGGWPGWIRLREVTNYGVSWNSLSGEMEGWAWADGVIGWISFNCNNQGVCGTSDYQVIYGTLPPTCVIELQNLAGNPISEVNLIGQPNDTFYIYVGGSTDDDGIVEVRFSSDDIQDGIVQGSWTGWYDWNISSGDWDATAKRMSWSFATDGSKEVWAEVRDNTGQTDQDNANIYVNSSPVSVVYCYDCWGESGYIDDLGGGWHNSNFTRYVYDCDSDGSLNSCEYYVFDNIAGGVTDAGNRTCSANCVAYASKTVTVGLGADCPSQGQNACSLGVRSTDNDSTTGDYDIVTYNIDFEFPSIGLTSPTTALEGIPQTYTASVSDNSELNYCWLYVDGGLIGSMDISPSPCQNGAPCTVSRDHTFTTPGAHTMYLECADHYDQETASYLNATSGSPVTVTVGANSVPVITAGLDYTTSPCSEPTTQSGCIVDFTATITDGDGDTLTYTWDFGDGTSTAPATTSPPANIGTSHYYNIANNYIILLTVSDGRGGVATGTVNLNVNNPTIVVAGCAGLISDTLCTSPYSGVAPLNGVDLKGAVSGTMFGDMNYKFDCTNDGTWELEIDGTATNPYSAIDLCNYSVAGNYTAKVFVERGPGSAEDTITITVSANQPPVAGICCQLCASPSCTTYTGEIFTLINNCSDPNGDGDIAKSEWDILGWGITPDLTCCASGCDSTDPLCDFTVQTQLLGAGNYTAQLYVEDILGLFSTTTQGFTILQDALADFRCSLDNSNWQSCEVIRPSVGETVYFLDQSSPSQGAAITNRSWTFEDGNPPSNIDNETNPSTQFQLAGGKQVSLMITDSAGRTSSKDYTISASLPLPEWKEIPPF